MLKSVYAAIALVLLFSVVASPVVFATELEGTDPDLTDQSAVEQTDPSIEVTEDYDSEPTEEVTDPSIEQIPNDDTVEVTEPNGVYDEVPVDLGPEPGSQKKPESTKPIPSNWVLALEAIQAGASDAAYWARSGFNDAMASCNQSPVLCGAPVAFVVAAAAVVTSPVWAL